MRKKIPLFLLTMVCGLLASPPQAKAWNWGTDYEVAVWGEGFKYASSDKKADWAATYDNMTWNSTYQRYECDITPTGNAVKFKFTFKTDGGKYRAPSDRRISLSTSNSNLIWSSCFNDAGTDQTFNDLSQDKTYTIYLTRNVNPEGAKYAICEKAQPVDIWDFSKSDRPKKITIQDANNGSFSNFDLAYENGTVDGKTYNWKGEFTTTTSVSSHSGFLNFTIKADEKTFYVKSGSNTLAVWSVKQKQQVDGQKYYQGGVGNSKNYVFYLRASDDDNTNFDWMIKEKSSLNPVAKPVFTPASGSQVVLDTETVNITCATSGATIYYALDNAAPTISDDCKYDPAKGVKFTSTGSHTIHAIAVKSGMATSSASATYKVVGNAPTYTVYVNFASTGWDPSSIRAFFKKGSGQGAADITVDADGNYIGWPGMAPNSVTGGHTAKFVLRSNVKPQIVIFNNGNSTGSNQTIDFGFTDGKTYYLNAQDDNINNGNWYDNGSGATTGNVNLPYGPDDFKEPKYFLVGARLGMWRLQPEWELIKHTDGTWKVNGGRFMFFGNFAVAKVTSYANYVKSVYDFYSASQRITKDKTSISGIKIVNTGNEWRNFEGTTKDLISAYDSKHQEANKVAMTFRYNEDTNKNEAQNAMEDKGTWVDAITLSGADSGYTLNFTITNPTNATHRIFTLVGESIYNQFYCNNMQDNTGFAPTPKIDKSTVLGAMNGWQEGWIQFGPTGMPYHDANGKYLYHTAYTNEIFDKQMALFNTRINDGQDFPYTSKSITFVHHSQLAGLDSDPYREFYKAINGQKTIKNGMEIKGGKIEDGTQYRFNAKVVGNGKEDETITGNFETYVVRDVFLRGRFKVWSGGGGNSKRSEAMGEDNGNARWDHENGGPVAVKVAIDDKGNTKNVPVVVDCSKIYIGEGKTTPFNRMGIDQGLDADFKTNDQGTLVHYDRVVLFYNTTGGMDQSFIMFIQNDASPMIQAFNQSGTGNERKLWCRWQLQNVETQNNDKITGYTVTRYRVLDIGDTNPYVVKTVTYSDGDYKSVQEFKEVTDETRYYGQEDLTPGTYYYHLVVHMEDGTTRETNSNRVTVYGDELAPDLRVMQLVQLNATGYDALKEGFAGEFQEKQCFLTYRDETLENDPPYFVINSNVLTRGENEEITAEIRQVPSDKARNVLKDYTKYTWTAQFYVRGLDYTNYKRVMSQLFPGEANQYQAEPTLTLNDVEAAKENTAYLPDTGIKDYSAIATNKYTVTYLNEPDKEYIGTIVDRKGLLRGGEMKGTLTYWYGTGEAQKTANNTHHVPFQPVVPQPLGLEIKYALDPVTFGTPLKTAAETHDFGTEKPADNAEYVYKFKTAFPAFGSGNGSTDVEFYAPENAITTERHMNAIVNFQRPNISENILKRYDIHYAFNLWSIKADDATPSDEVNFKRTTYRGVEYYDLSEDTQANPYHIVINDVHPSTRIYPYFEIAKTTYVRTDDKSKQLVATYKYGDLAVTGKRTTSATIKMTEIGLGVNPSELPDSHRWFMVAHKDFSYDNVDFGTQQQLELADRTQLFMLKISNSHGEAYGPNLYHHNHAATADAASQFVNDNVLYIGTLKDEKNADNSLKAPEVTIIPIYVFFRDPAHNNLTGEGFKTTYLTYIEGTGTKEVEGQVQIQQSAVRTAATKTESDAPATATNKFVINTANISYDPKTNRVIYDATSETDKMIVLPGTTTDVAPENAPIQTGIEDVTGDAATEAVYYNLQGIRVYNPIRGNVYIRCQGSGTEKVVF